MTEHEDTVLEERPVQVVRRRKADHGIIKMVTGETRAVYANAANVLTGPEEATLFFGQRNEDDPESAVLVSKVILSLPHLKRLGRAINDNIQRYEAKFGEVKTELLDQLTPEARAEVEAEIQRQVDGLEAATE